MSEFPPAVIGIAEILEAIAETRPDQECLIYRDKRLTWNDINLNEITIGAGPAFSMQRDFRRADAFGWIDGLQMPARQPERCAVIH